MVPGWCSRAAQIAKRPILAPTSMIVGLGQLDLRMVVGPTHEDLVVDVLGRPLKWISDRKVQIGDAHPILGCNCHLFLRQGMVSWSQKGANRGTLMHIKLRLGLLSQDRAHVVPAASVDPPINK